MVNINYGIITTKQKINFFKYALNKLKQGFPFGFCALYSDYFGESSNKFKLLPELLDYKPKKKFYNAHNDPSNFSDQFWFPLSDDQTERIKICNEILAKLKSL